MSSYEYKRIYHPKLGRFVYKHKGSGIIVDNIFKPVGRVLRGCPRKNHAKGATAYITDLVHTLHTGITW